MRRINKRARLPKLGIKWVRRKSWPDEWTDGRGHLSLVDLFCGCGGLTLGVWEAARQRDRRLDIRLAVDHAQEPLEVYRDNFQCDQEAARCEDVDGIFPGKLGSRESSPERYWRKRIGALDLLVAGPPCQGHSDLNNSTRRDDPRNSLYLRAIRAAEVLLPKAVIIENVPAVLHDKTDVVLRASKALSEKFYVSGATVDFLRVGVPQRRRRHILVATRDVDFDVKKFMEELPPANVVIRDFISDLEDEPNRRNGPFCSPTRMTEENEARVRHLFEHDLHDLPNERRPPCHRDKDHSYVSMYGRLWWDRPAQTITSGYGSIGQGRYVHPRRRRTLTPHEAARLQGFPDFFDFTAVEKRTALREMIANAVPPQFAAAIVFTMLQKGIL
jgi:DNA (cytosine-5)-methyltransferase 1